MGFLLQESESVSKKRIVVKAGSRILFLDPENLQLLEAEGNYVRIHTQTEQHVVRCPISLIESELDPSIFLRISRSVIVNMNYVREMHPWFRGNYRVVMTDGTELTLTNNYRSRLDNFIGIPIGKRPRPSEG